jgi:hypothetical protein
MRCAPYLTYLRDAGFEELAWIDKTAPALQWYRKRLAPKLKEPPPLGIHLVLSDDFSEMLHNQVLNLSEDRISVVQAVFERA